MMKFLALVLAFVFGFFGAIALWHLPKGLTTPSSVGIGRIESNSLASTNTQAFEANGIQMEIQVPYSVLSIPEKTLSLDTIVPVSILIVNNTQTPIQFGFESLVPELFDSHGQALQRQEVVDRDVRNRAAICSIVEPRSSRRFNSFIKLYWANNKLQLTGNNKPGSFWYFDALQTETYQLRFTYNSPGGEVSCLDPETQQIRRIEGLRAAQSATTFVPLQIVQPLLIDSNTVEVDGIQFEILIPNRVLTIPANKPNATTPVSLVLRITNNTQQAVRFTRFDTVIPQLFKSDGTELKRDGGRNWTSMPTVSDCPLLQPGETAIFGLDARLFWRNNKLQLEWFDGFGGTWFFDDIKPGTYQIGMGYTNWVSEHIRMYDPEIKTLRPLTDLWKGAGLTPLVEIRLVQQ